MSKTSKIEKEEEVIKTVKKNKKVLKYVLLLILIMLIISVVIFFIKVKENGGGASGVIGAMVGNDSETLANLPKIYCVLLGKSQTLTDTIMLASYAPKTQEASLLTIPRDTFVGKNKETATPNNKINALYSIYSGDPEKTVEAVKQITGIDVKNYCMIDTNALIEMVDLIGGVNFDVPINMDYEDPTQDLAIHVKAGYQLLDGKNAEGVVRFRHNQDGSTYSSEYGEQDLGRSRTQRAFLTELAKQILKPQNLLKIGGFIDIFYDNVKTNMNLNDIKDYLPYAVKFDTEKLKTGILPGVPQYCNNYSFYLHDKEETKNVVNELFNSGETVEDIEDNTNTILNVSESGDTKDKDENSIKIELLNGTNNENALYNVKNKLEANGFTIVKTDDINATAKTTIINRNDLTKEQVESLEKVLGKGFVNVGSKYEDIDITVVIGNDY